MLDEAGGDRRDYAILQAFLRTGVLVSELRSLRLADVETEGRTLHGSSGKGMMARDVELEKMGLLALKNWLAIRPLADDYHLFLNKEGELFGERGVRKLEVKCRQRAGIAKKPSCDSLRHTLAA